MVYEKQTWNKYDDLKTEEENIQNGAVVTDNRMNHMEEGISAIDLEVTSHESNKTNPHSVTKEQVGLSNVSNYGIATEAEATAGTSNEKYLTPLLTKKAVKSYVDKTDVGLSNVDNVKQASKYEFEAHTENKTNPHGVTATQVGAYIKEESDSKFAPIQIVQDVTTLSQTVETKANSSEVVHLTGDETIAGKKTFTGTLTIDNLEVSGDFPKGELTAKTGFAINGTPWYRVRQGLLQISCTGISITANVPAGAWKDVCSFTDADSINSTGDATTVIMNGSNANYIGARVRVVNGVLRILPEAAVAPTQYMNDFITIAVD